MGCMELATNALFKSLHMSLDLPEMGLEEFREMKRGKNKQNGHRHVHLYQ